MNLAVKKFALNVYGLICKDGVYNLGPIDVDDFLVAVNSWLEQHVKHPQQVLLTGGDMTSQLSVLVRDNKHDDKSMIRVYPSRRVYTVDEARTAMPLDVRSLLDDLNKETFTLTKSENTI